MTMMPPSVVEALTGRYQVERFLKSRMGTARKR